ncbi:MAG: hypothetical protein KDD64_17060, partial [Bdellovibrionales bacterium]|nr:hypothetical protein [Bdellovibrionales bacterium]
VLAFLQESILKRKQFKLGDKVVYPGHGVGEITEVIDRTIAGSNHQVYQMTLIDKNKKEFMAMVPVAQADSVGLRRVVDKKTVDKVFEILRDRSFKIDTQTWNRRFREYTQKLKTGSVFEIAEVIRDLSVLSIDKDLSFGEKKMLESAQNLLASEIAIARSRSEEKVMTELREMFAA